MKDYKTLLEKNYKELNKSQNLIFKCLRNCCKYFTDLFNQIKDYKELRAEFNIKGNRLNTILKIINKNNKNCLPIYIIFRFDMIFISYKYNAIKSNDCINIIALYRFITNPIKCVKDIKKIISEEYAIRD